MTPQERFGKYPRDENADWQYVLNDKYMIELVNAATAEGEVRAYKHILRLLVEGKTHE